MNAGLTQTDKGLVAWASGAMAFSTTSEPCLFIVEVPGMPAFSVGPTPADQSAFDRHVAGLPSLEDLVARWRTRNPKFDGLLQAAREKQYREMLAEVEAGRMSRIRAERLRLRWTQAQLADRAGLKQANVSRLEKPSARLSIRTAKRLAEALKMPDYRELLPK